MHVSNFCANSSVFILLINPAFLAASFLFPAGGIERSGCAYVRPSVDQVKFFVQDRISRPINGSKFIFYMRMYLYETSRNIQEP